MKKVLSIMLVCCLSLLSACATTPQAPNVITIDGKIDAVEAATINLAVGVAMSQRPDTILPAYGVSTTLLTMLANDVQTVTVSGLEIAIAKEITKLNLDPITQQSFNDLIVLIKAQMTNTLKIEGLPDTTKLVIIKQVVQIVHDASAARLGIVK